MVPLFFPDGGLYATPGTLHIRIRTRLVSLFVAVNLIPSFVFLLIVRGTYRSHDTPAQMLGLMRTAVSANALLFIVIGVVLTMLINSNFTRSVNEIIRVLRGIRNGRRGPRSG
ncbi:MAG: hypothetical protein WAM61_09660 [Desulfobacterales bacterium]